MDFVKYHNIPSQQTADVEVEERRQSVDGNGTTDDGFSTSIRFPIRRSVAKEERLQSCSSYISALLIVPLHLVLHVTSSGDALLVSVSSYGLPLRELYRKSNYSMNDGQLGHCSRLVAPCLCGRIVEDVQAGCIHRRIGNSQFCFCGKKFGVCGTTQRSAQWADVPRKADALCTWHSRTSHCMSRCNILSVNCLSIGDCLLNLMLTSVYDASRTKK
ncbi:hypothetical protein TSMEX_008839 [Taenia solium]|eukprot:TsM_001075900 transcript=TsM_001075900 gene=TsM_001075900